MTPLVFFSRRLNRCRNREQTVAESYLATPDGVSKVARSVLEGSLAPLVDLRTSDIAIYPDKHGIEVRGTRITTG